MPVRRRRRGDPNRGRRPPGAQLALLSARGRARAALWLQGARSLRTRRRPPLQPRQAAARPVREGDRRRRRLGARRQRAAVHPQRRRGRRLRARRRGRRRRGPEVGRGRPDLRLGGGHAAAGAVHRHAHLRDPRQGLHDASPRGSRGPARDVRGVGLRAGDRLPQAARDHGGRAAPGASHLRRVASYSSEGFATTGATARSATSRRTPNTPPPVAAGSRSGSSRGWSKRCTRRGSR